ncbi:ECF transporter S component [Palaeococcus ferrophilus]|uniref:ECF transporter S component n=1 Tax=Palaeococcus ferrophilus TaxID=83868 RepID=UPI00064ED766
MNEEQLMVIAPYVKWLLLVVALAYLGYIFVLKKEEFKSAWIVAISALMTALVAIATMIIRIPTPQTSGYINFGDTMVMLSAVLFGPLVGGFAGGFGSAIADAFGYPHWAPFTLIIKGVEGWVVGYITSKRDDFTSVLVATIVGGFLMVLGYFLVEVWLYGIGGATAELPGNTLQAVTGVVVGGGLGYLLRRSYPQVSFLLKA